jgi:hypothetical protein
MQTTNEEILQAALTGYRAQIASIAMRIEEIEVILKPRRTRSAAKPKAPAKRKLSSEGRAKLVAAQKKRWAAFRKAK